jgi:P pilus assembly chaperone PapD
VANANANRPIPIKVSAKSWRLDIDGQDQRGATEDILVFPGQFVLGPSARRSVRVAVRYKDKPEVERSFRIIVQELPIDLEGRTTQNSGVKIVTSYATAFYVRPVNPQSRLRLSGVERQSDGLLFKITNEGNAHSHLRELALIFSQGAKTLRVDDPKHLPRFYNANLLAQSERHFPWRWPEDSASIIDHRLPFDVRLELECESCDGGRTVLRISVP